MYYIFLDSWSISFSQKSPPAPQLCQYRLDTVPACQCQDTIPSTDRRTCFYFPPWPSVNSCTVTSSWVWITGTQSGICPGTANLLCSHSVLCTTSTNTVCSSTFLHSVWTATSSVCPCTYPVSVCPSTSPVCPCTCPTSSPIICP